MVFNNIGSSSATRIFIIDIADFYEINSF